MALMMILMLVSQMVMDGIDDGNGDGMDYGNGDGIKDGSDDVIDNIIKPFKTIVLQTVSQIEVIVGGIVNGKYDDFDYLARHIYDERIVCQVVLCRLQEKEGPIFSRFHFLLYGYEAKLEDNLVIW